MKTVGVDDVGTDVDVVNVDYRRAAGRVAHQVDIECRFGPWSQGSDIERYGGAVERDARGQRSGGIGIDVEERRGVIAERGDL